MADSGPVHVLLIEGNHQNRCGIRPLLERAPGIVIVGEAADGASGMRLFASLAADSFDPVAIIDGDLPDRSGIGVLRQIKALQPRARVLVVTTRDDAEHLRGVVGAGADGCLLSQSSADQLQAAIRGLARGEMFLSPQIARRLMNEIQCEYKPRRQVGIVTSRQREILQLLAGGSTGKEAAQYLGLSAKTVEYHRARLLGKLGVTNTAAAVRAAYDQGLL